MSLLGRVLGGLAAGMVSSARRKKNSSSGGSSSSRSSGGSGGSSTFPGGPASSGGSSSSGTSPYGANTNWDNERNYLNSLVSKGGGNGVWAKNQLGILDAAQKQYGNQQTSQPQTPSLPQFQYPSYQEYQQEAPQYESPYSDRIDSILNDVLNRDKFAYNVEDDPLYDQYKAQYMREGQRAMQDTLASTAANAGGMNSYAVSAAQQANSYYNSKMGDVIPQLYQAAYEKYLNEIDQKVQDLGILNQMDSNQYNRFRTTMDDWRGDRNFIYGMYQDQLAQFNKDRDFNYDVDRDQIADQRYDTEWGYNTTQSKKSDAYNRAMEYLSMGVMPDAATLEAAEISEGTADALLRQFQLTLAAQQMTSSGSRRSGSSGRGRSSRSRSSSDDDYAFGGDSDVSSNLYNAALEAVSSVPGMPEFKSSSQAQPNPLKSVTSFGPTLKQTYGQHVLDDIKSGKNDFDAGSILNLGLGPLSYEEIIRMINSGKLEW